MRAYTYTRIRVYAHIQPDVQTDMRKGMQTDAQIERGTPLAASHLAGPGGLWGGGAPFAWQAC